MDKDALARRLMQTFLDELAGHVRALDRNLLDLERAAATAGDTDELRELFRAAHSLKGAARAVNVGVLEAAAHHLEAIFAGIRDGTGSPDAALFALLFETVDAVRDAANRLGAGDALDGSPLAALLPRLRDASAGPTVAPRRDDTVPKASAGTSAPPPEPEADATADDRPRTGAPAEASVRIPASRLDRMLALAGELLVARRRTAGRDTDVARLREMVVRWEREWRPAPVAAGRGARRGHLAGGVSAAAEPARSPMGLPAHARENLRQLRQLLDDLSVGLAADRRAIEQVAAPLEAEIARARMVPFAAVCEGFDRLVRDLARGAGKDVVLTIAGGDIEIDRAVVEGIADPLRHLVRNAVDHGIEMPPLRTAAGKEPRGRIAMTAALRSGRVEIAVADDGGGFDVEAVRARALQRGLPVPEDHAAIVRLLFSPGFSTAPSVTAVSGRGVGLDVVKTAVEARRGSVEVTSMPGQGSRFALNLPLSLTLLPALLVKAAGQTYVIDSSAVRGMVRVEPQALATMEGRDVLSVGDAPVPIVSLAEVLGQPAPDPARETARVPIVVLDAAAGRCAFAVDELQAEQDVIVKDLGPRLRRVPCINGATVLPTGRIALILNAAELVAAGLGHKTGRATPAAGRPVETRKRLLVVDDSVTTRTLVKSILEAAGYDVLDAADGMEAWQVLHDRDTDLVVSDIEMPRMDGFALTEAIRGSRRFRTLPVILVTALEAEADRMRGLEAGADAYLVKSAFDQTALLEAIRQML